MVSLQMHVASNMYYLTLVLVFIADLKFQKLCRKCIGGSVYGCDHLATEMLLLIGCCDFFTVVNAFNFFRCCAFNFGGKDFVIQPHDALRRICHRAFPSC